MPKIEIEAELVTETDNAFLIVVDGNDDNKVWISKKLGMYEHTSQHDRTKVDVTLPEWFAKKEGLI